MIAFMLAAALTLPNSPAPQPKHFDRTTWALVGADASVRALDVYSTHYMLHEECMGPWGEYHCHVERVLPKFIANHDSAMIAYSAATVAGNILTARFLIKHGHPKMAKAVLMFDIAGDGTLAVRNMFLKPPPLK